MQTAETTFPKVPFFYSLRQLVADAIFPEGRDRRERAEREANVDALTGVANRRAFDLALATAEADPTTAVVLFDADNFGKVNKAAGQVAGDAMLREVAKTIHTAARSHGVGGRVFRIGGDEFAVLCDSDDAESLRNFAEILFGSRAMLGGFVVSLTGVVAASYAGACAGLQARKRERKESAR
jgi:GGDEF domain-containing protein